MAGRPSEHGLPSLHLRDQDRHCGKLSGSEGGNVIAHRIARKIYLDKDNNLRGWKGHVLYTLYVALAFVEDLLGLPV